MTLFFCSCGQQDKTAANNNEQKALTDSAKVEQYYRWSEKVEYIKVYNFDLSVLAKTEKNRDTVMLLNFITSYYDSIKLFDEFPYTPEVLVKSVYAIDFNGDELLDIIYDGPTGWEQNVTQLFLNKGTHYEKVFSGFQDVIEADFSNNRLISFTLINPGCCADPQIVEYYYSVTYADNNPQFKLNKTIGYLDGTEKPQKLLTPPKKFYIRKDNTKLRTDCYILDNVDLVYASNGNVIANYKSGSTGLALGFKKDKNVEWIYAIMDANNKFETSDFSTFKEQPTYIKGWLLKTDITGMKL